MKKRILLIFIFDLLINLVFAFLLNKSALLPKNDIIALLIGSYVVYAILNLHLYIQIKVKNHLGYTLTLFIGLFVSIIAFFVLLLNLKNDRILFIPMMYDVSMLCTFINWVIEERRK